jgi:hypothetical protein
MKKSVFFKNKLTFWMVLLIGFRFPGRSPGYYPVNIKYEMIIPVSRMYSLEITSTPFINTKRINHIFWDIYKYKSLLVYLKTLSIYVSQGKNH